MIVVNENGLSDQEIAKILRPYAENHGEPIDLEEAGKAAADYFRAHPDLLKGAAEILDTPQS